MNAQIRSEPLTTPQRLLTLVRLRARRQVLWLEHLNCRQSVPDSGRAITAALGHILDAEEIEREQTAFFATGPARELGRQAEAASRALGEDPSWSALLATFALNPGEEDLLALLVALDLDPQLSRVMAFLHGDASAVRATVWIAARLAGRTPAPIDTSNLRAWLLALPAAANACNRLMTPWEVDPVLADALTTGIWRDGVIVSATCCQNPGQIASLACLQPEAIRELSELRDLRDAELVGPPGCGRQTLAAQFAARRSQSLLSADLQELVESPVTASEAITRVLRLAAVTGALAYFRNAELASFADWNRARLLGIPYLRGVRHSSGHALPVALKPLAIEERLKLWRSLSDAEPPESLHRIRQTPLEIVETRGGRKRYRPRPDESLLTLLPTPYDWDDLVVSGEALSQLRAFESQIRLRWPVYEQWGFARLAHLGLGMTALFGGPSGTGKTMAAQVVARAVGLDLLRVDLAGVINKYVGETEKKIREVFDACEDSSALLFFDEADALFGQRTQVRDAQDRFANISINYILQRLDRFDGISILATNRRGDLDHAFVRRLRFVIEFLPPRPPERLALWRRALIPAAYDGRPIVGDIDFGYLSERLNMTGAEIKNTALGAAFLAREESKPIGMHHVLASAQRELAKQGQRIRSSWEGRADA